MSNGHVTPCPPPEALQVDPRTIRITSVRANAAQVGPVRIPFRPTFRTVPSRRETYPRIIEVRPRYGPGRGGLRGLGWESAIEPRRRRKPHPVMGFLGQEIDQTHRHNPWREVLPTAIGIGLGASIGAVLQALLLSQYVRKDR